MGIGLKHTLAEHTFNNCMVIFDDQYLDLKKLSRYSCLAVPTLRDYLKVGLPHYKLKGKVLVKRSEFDRWMQSFKIDQNQEIDQIVQDAMRGLSAKQA